ncbi:hypothetical protein [Gorillibacterium sp. CAU 1737]|uniref:hypothetical protein n=1 Tax=Gorillibacterium sp. CAU 1737 TaxID=3140362 RepID=UPI003260DC60
MTKAKAYLRDILLTAALTAAVGSLLSLAGASLTVLLKGTEGTLWMESARGILFLTGGAGLLLSAAFLLKKNKPMRVDHEHQWKRRFHALRPLPVLLQTSLGLLAIGILWDYAIFYGG